MSVAPPKELADMTGWVIFWDVVPYVTLAVVAVGTWWRYRYDKFGWTTRSSQLYESRLLRIGSPMFHFGILVVIAGHIIGLVIPESWTDLIMSDHVYHVQAMVLGAIAGITTLGGIALLVYRRRTTGPVFLATTVNDKVMYAVLVLAIVAGLACTLIGATPVGAEHDYRESVSPWFRSIWILQPRGDLMVQAPVWFHIHVMIAMVLFCLWPFTRLVHVFSAPIAYLFRPYIVYRSRDVAGKGELVGSHPQRRGW
ncbi:nitrate reductase subunit gamma [Mycolicibacterium elephantis DSM 44368]|uniref:Nitrate reductase-like protein NarX n=2 Tax=Mycolicibacterium elephantis TaxID=81858 RepID=A0A439DL95_9MYCO|nr:nitrate reductase subunit gamma [Mycolicibacterium elephantis DSM 44368]